MRWKKTFSIEAAVVSNRGLLREGNEDNFYLDGTVMDDAYLSDGVLFQNKSSNKKQVFGVCDGIGGQACGEEASYLTAKSLFGLNLLNKASLDRDIFEFLRDINQQCRGLADERGHPGSTLAMVVILENNASVIHIGDSRIYFMRGGELTLLTRDHSQAQAYLDQGIIDADSAGDHPSAAILTQYIGMPGEISPSVTKIKLKREDVFLLCSDGLSDLVTESEMARLLERETSAKACKELTALALSYGGYDNITAMVLKVN